jgi:hypothetical protein
MSLDAFSVPDYSSGGGNAPYQIVKFSKTCSAFTVRILPPMKSLRESKRWSLYFGLIFGWNGRNSKDPTKMRFRPVLSLEERDHNSGTFTGTSDLEALIKQMNEKKDFRASQLVASGAPDDAKELRKDAEYNKLADWCYNHSVNRRHYFLAIDREGKPCLVMVTHKCKKALDAVLETLVQEGEDPIGMNGMYLTFKRTGQGNQVIDSVSPAMEQEMVNGKKMSSYVRHQMTAEVAAAVVAALPDLNEYKESFRLPPSAMSELAVSGGDPVEVDRIWSSYKKPRERAQVPATPMAPPPPPKAQPEPTPAPVPVPAPVPAPVAAPAVDNAALVAQLQAQMAALMAQMANAQSPPAPAPVPVPAATVPMTTAAPVIPMATAPVMASEPDDDLDALFE